jgi:polyhydroxybutyrate depolymerase
MLAKKAVSSLTVVALCGLACETNFTPPAGAGGAPLDTGMSGPPPQGGTTSGGGVTGGGAIPNVGGSTGSGAMPSGGEFTGSGAIPNVGGSTGSGGAGVIAGAGGTPGQGMGGAIVGAGGAPMIGSGGTAPAAGGAPPVQTCPATSLQPGTTTQNIQFGGAARSYILHVPASYTGKTPVPLVLDFHGILLNDTIQESISGWQAKSDAEGFVVAWPNGIDAAWNVGPCCTTSRTVDDVGFAKAVVNQIEGQTCVDKKRVYATGYSMGGGMTIDLACNAADVFAAAAPAAFDLMDPAQNNWPCSPSRPITVIDFRSSGDPIVPYNGGPTNPPNGLPIVVTFLGAVKTFQKFAQLDQCTGSPVDDSAVGAGCQTYKQCGAGVQVTLCTKQGGGHDVADTNVAWSVLKNYTLP